jgi:ParB family transcriptional regulator, chromosome partitioning protein
MKITELSVKELKPYAKNTKKHNKTQIANVAESIKQYGFVQPIVVDKDNNIVIGHCRYEAAKKLKLETVPCVCVDELTDEQVKALRIVDNKSNESPWDMEFLADELAEIDMNGFDFDFGINAVDENDIPDVEEKELKPYKKVHYLITLDINENDKVIDLIKQIENVGGVEVDSTLN